MRSITIACRLMVFSLLLAACQKADFDKTPTGEGIDDGSFRIKSPVSLSTIALNSAIPTQNVVFSWSSAKPGVNKPLTYKWIAVPKDGNINEFKFELPADNDGKDTKLTITQEKLDQFLASKGVTEKGTIELKWSVQASNGETQVISEDVAILTLKCFQDGATPFMLYGPEPIIDPQAIDFLSATGKFNFRWQKSVPKTGGPAVKYRVLFALEANDFSKPLFTIESDNNGNDSGLVLTYKRLNDSLNKAGETDLTKDDRLKWTVQATSGNWNQQSDNINALNLVREVKFYIYGSINGNNINDPVRIIPDLNPSRVTKVFYSYMLFNKNATFKFLGLPGDAGTAYGVTGGSNGEYTTAIGQGSNITIADSGVYRITIDLRVNKIYVQKKAPGTVGSFQGWNTASPNPGTYISRNKFSSVIPSGTGIIFKFHDGGGANDWNDSEPNLVRYWGKDKKQEDVLSNAGDAGNLSVPDNKLTRVLWDASDYRKLKYKTFDAAMYLIGSATPGGWSNGSDLLPALTYQSNGKWKANVTLIPGEFKFLLVKNTWDYNYGGTAPDASGNLLSGGGVKPDGSNIIISTGGTYTVEIDEISSTYKVTLVP
ncbi:SusF/SusE family outer membrane protein [Pseudoflavitalea sp. G-6-1-2]|uniref:SusE domain-containing protein n=1 Tax=Pseudoflavitalea sp. G-6-1-2 TaxID=2728841 RepID=UPI001469F02F|nr:SusE domain-containing protein [Pseudoflavitalea sp. G-6-1-2]NML20210.1 SusF/SusE family outer membrane protein [Pseudoflavitalea sp. G-6-1-2]